MKKRVPRTPTVSARKTKKADKSKGTIPLVLTDVDINEIGDKV